MAFAAAVALTISPVQGDVDLGKVDRSNAPIATSGNNVYITWWLNKTGNDEIMFRASTDGGQTFGEKVNLSNSSGSESHNTFIAAADNVVYVTWWERNQTANELLARISGDNGKTFGPLLHLSQNGTIGLSQ
jgi:hypothetical protein